MLDQARKIFFAALLLGAATPAFAADYEEPIVEIPPQVVAHGGWYMRGFIGMTNQSLDRLESSFYRDEFLSEYGFHDGGGFSSSPLFGGGIGYQFNDYLRGDITVEYRGKADFEALDHMRFGDTVFTNDMRAKKSEWLVLANAYVEGGDFYGITPYIGAGIGASRNTISHFRDINLIIPDGPGGSYAGEDSKWNFAWALHAGLGIKATERLTIDLGYSFVSLGDAHTAEIRNDDPLYDIPNDGMHFKDLTSHDLKLGVRYALY